MKKKRLLYLVALLLMVALGAKADGLAITSNDIGKFICADGSVYDTYSDADNAGKTAVAMIASVDETNHKTLGFSLCDDVMCNAWADAESIIATWAEDPNNVAKLSNENLSWKLPTIQEWQQMFIGCGAAGQVTDNPTTMSYSELRTNLENGNTSWFLFVGYSYYWSATEEDEDNAWCLTFSDGTATFSYEYKGNEFFFTPLPRHCFAWRSGARAAESHGHYRRPR